MFRTFCSCPTARLLILTLCLCCLCCLCSFFCLASCSAPRTVSRTAERTVRDTLRRTRTDTLRTATALRDSIYVHDSVYHAGGQLVRERVRFRFRTVHDTLWRTVRDTLRHTRTDTVTTLRTLLPPAAPDPRPARSSTPRGLRLLALLALLWAFRWAIRALKQKF